MNPAEQETRELFSNSKLDQILDQYLNDMQQGRACSRAELLAKHPDLASDLSECLDGIEMIAGLDTCSNSVPQQMGDFSISEPIGQGAMGVVYRAEQISLKRPVALKVLRYAASGKQASKRFEREAELVATLQHPHIVPVYAFGQHESLNYFAMQLIDGESLSQWSARPETERDPKTLATWVAQVARALAHAHGRDIVHRDIKPSNLLKDKQGKIWLTDFGLARRFDDVRMSMTGAMLGTPNYMSPEQASPGRHPIDYRTDIYSLGATLFELLTGRTVFQADTPHAVLAQVLTEDAPSLSESIPGCSRDLETILIKCLASEPIGRYQTADQLADDLEAFVADRSIKARRPGPIERATRWRRQNQKAVSWATTAVAAAISLLAIGLATWSSWKSSHQGTLKIDSDEGPFVGRLISEDGEATPAFTIPTQQKIAIDAGQYQLQMWTGGRFGESQDLFVDRGQHTTISTKLPELGAFPDRTVEGIPQAWRRPVGDAIVLFHEKGITAVDGTTGKDLWTTDAADIIKNESKPKASKRSLTAEEKLVRSFHWNWNRNQVRDYTDARIPRITDSFPDVNSDQTADLLVACQKQPILFALDGASGKRIWRYGAVPTLDKDDKGFQHSRTGCLGQAQLISDIDNDGVVDVIASFYSSDYSFGDRIYRWQDAISGKTGKRIWRLEMPETWFDPKNLLLPSSHISFGEKRDFRHRSASGTSWQYRNEPAFRRSRNQDTPIMSWPSQLVRSSNNTQASTDLIFTICGSRLTCVRAIDGKPSKFNAGKPLELGFFCALAPVLVQNNTGQPIGLLLCEQVALPDKNTNTPAQTRFTMLSTETAKSLWQYDAVCDPGYTGVTPDWPLVEDINGDGIPEIIIGDGADLEKAFYQGASCLASLQTLDAISGKPLWQPHQRAKIRGQERQVHNLLTGPDADGDSWKDIYVVSPMHQNATSTTPVSIFIDVVSGMTGQRIRTIQSRLPTADEGIDLQTPRWWGTSSDGSPQMLVATKDFDGQSERQSTFLIPTGTGEITHIGNQLEHPFLIETTNGQKNLLAHKPRNRNNIAATGQLISIESRSRQAFKTIGQKYRTIDDLDGDGVKDLVSQRQGLLRALSGKTGEELWLSEMKIGSQDVVPAGGDVDADGVQDILNWSSFYYRGSHRNKLDLLSGRTGQKRWTTTVVNDDSGARPACYCRDLDVDGNMEILILYRPTTSRFQTRPSLRLACFDGLTGDSEWELEVSPADSEDISPHRQHRSRPIHFADVNSDGKLEIVCSRFSSTDTQLLSVFNCNGQKLWDRSLSDVPASFPLRTELIAVIAGSNVQGMPKQPPKIARASSTENNGQPKWTVSLDWFDGESGKRVSTWSGVGRLRRYPRLSGDPPGIWNGIPFTVLDGNKAYTGLCVQDRNSNKMELVVLDSSSSPATEVQRVEVVQPENVGRGYAWTGQFLVEDINADGRTDVVYHDGNDLVAKTLVDGKEIRRRAVPADWRTLREIDMARQQLLLHTSLDNDRRVKLINLETFETCWDLQIPANLAFEASLQANKHATQDSPDIPHMLYQAVNQGVNNHYETVVMAGVFDEYLGDDTKIRNSLATNPTIGIPGLDADPRMIESLPWSGGRLIEKGVYELLASALLVAMGAIVFPFLFLQRMFRHSNWSLQTFLLLPLAFVIPYYALQLPLVYAGRSLGQDWVASFGQSAWVGKLIVASLFLPVISFFWSLVSHLWASRWRSFIIIVLLTVLFSAAIGASSLIANIQRFPSGSRLNFADWGHAYLLPFGIWTAGFGILLQKAFVAVWRWGRGVLKLISRSPKPLEAAS